MPAEYLLFVGSIEPRKNLSLLLRAYPLLPASLRLPVLVVGRESKYKAELVQLALRLGVEKHLVWVHGLSDNQQLRQLYAGAQALVYPSLYEGFGLPVVEGLLSRVPVITSNRSALPEAAGPTSLLVDPESPEDLAAALEKVLGQAALRQQMVEKGYQYAISGFSPQATTAHLVDLYGEVVRSKGIENR